MQIVKLISTIAFAALTVSPLHAQDKAASAPTADKQVAEPVGGAGALPVSPASASTADKQVAEDCAKEHGKHHEHAAEKGTGGGMKSKCVNEKSAAKKGTKKPLHDHKKEHKS